MKQKTHKGIAKRFKVTKSGKTLKTKAGQNKYNARESGKIGINKRRPHQLPDAQSKVLKKLVKR